MPTNDVRGCTNRMAPNVPKRINRINCIVIDANKWIQPIRLGRKPAETQKGDEPKQPALEKLAVDQYITPATDGVKEEISAMAAKKAAVRVGKAGILFRKITNGGRFALDLDCWVSIRPAAPTHLQSVGDLPFRILVIQ